MSDEKERSLKKQLTRMLNALMTIEEPPNNQINLLINYINRPDIHIPEKDYPGVLLLIKNVMSQHIHLLNQLNELHNQYVKSEFEKIDLPTSFLPILDFIFEWSNKDPSTLRKIINKEAQTKKISSKKNKSKNKNKGTTKKK